MAIRQAGTPPREARTGLQSPARRAGENGHFKTVDLHYAINRPAGAVRGESDLAPLLRWLTATPPGWKTGLSLNRFRQTVLFVINAEVRQRSRAAASQAAVGTRRRLGRARSSSRRRRRRSWDVINRELESSDANTDGLALKKIIAVDPVPLHFWRSQKAAQAPPQRARAGRPSDI